MSEQVTYVCQNSPHRQLKVEVDGELVVVQFESGSVKVTAEVATVLDALFKKRPKLGVGVVKADKAAALKIAEQHKQAHAIKGGVTAGAGFTKHSTEANLAIQMQQLGANSLDANAAADAIIDSQDTSGTSEVPVENATEAKQTAASVANLLQVSNK